MGYLVATVLLFVYLGMLLWPDEEGSSWIKYTLITLAVWTIAFSLFLAAEKW